MAQNCFESITIDKLPPKLRALIEPNIGAYEEVLCCALLTEQGFSLLGKTLPQAVVVTNQKLLVTHLTSLVGSASNGGIVYPVTEPFFNNPLLVIENSRIISVRAEASGRFTIDYGLVRVRDSRQTQIQADPLIVHFPANWVDAMKRIFDTARAAPQAQAASTTGLASGLAKLAELYQSGALTDAEYAAAKKKLIDG